MFRVLILGSAFALSSSVFGDVETSLGKLEHWKSEYTRADLFEAVTEIRAGLRTNDHAAWHRLRHLTANDGIRGTVRLECLRLAWEKADSVTASELLSLLGEWVSRLKTPIALRERLDSGPAGDHLVLMRVFLEEGLPAFQGLFADQTPVLRFLTELATLEAADHVTGRLSVDAIAKNPAPIEARRACALTILSKRPASGVLDESLAVLLDSSCLPMIREFVRASPDARHFHFHAAAALAHFGDLEIIPELRAWQPKLAEVSKNLAGRIDGMIWQIELQHPPEKLLEHIASVGHPAMREWAIRRAVELGVSKEDIRRAILAHADKVEPVTEKRIKPGLPSIKLVGMDLGVLEPTDLPDVALPERGDTP